MAITIEQEPTDSIIPVYNDIYFAASSTNYAQPAFKYILDIYYDSALQARIKLTPNPTNNLAIYNASRILENAISFNFGEALEGFHSSTASYKNFFIKFGEEYEVAGVLTEFLNLDQSSVFTAFNASLEFLEYLTYTSATYDLTSSSAKFLTNAPTTLNIKSNQSALLYMFSKTAGNHNRMNIITYDTNNNVLQTCKISNAFTASSGFFNFGSGGYQLNIIPGGQFISGAQPIITASVAKYTLQVMNASNVAKSQLITYNIVDGSCKYDMHRLIFLNKLGGFDSFNFDMVSKKNVPITRKSYSGVGFHLLIVHHREGKRIMM